MSAILYFVPVNQKIKVSEPVDVDGIVIWRTPELKFEAPGLTINNTSLNLLNEKDEIVLHIGFRRRENVIVFNAHNSSGWLVEERVSFGDRLDGKNHTVTVYDHGDRYQILMNGTTAYYFKKQIQGRATALQYLADSGQAPMFSNPIVAETYTNLAALVPGQK